MKAWRAAWWMVVVLVAGSGCLPASADKQLPGPRGPQEPADLPVDPLVAAPFGYPFARTDYAPAPLSGGTLTLVDQRTALVVDADRERLWRVDLVSGAAGQAQLPAGSRPRRAVVAPDGSVAVLLRGSGQVATLAVPELLASGVPAGLRLEDVCPEPRDLAFDPADGARLVTCQDGTLVRDAASARTVTHLAADLRDLVVGPGGVATTSFRRAELRPASGGILTPNSSADATAGVAWRTIATPLGPLMLHQLASNRSIVVAAPAPSSQGGSSSPYGGGDFSDVGTGCAPGALVLGALTLFPPGGTPITAAIGDVVPVDVAARSLGGRGLQVAVAGVGGTGLRVYTLQAGLVPGLDALCGSLSLSRSGQFTGVRYLDDGTLVAHDRQSAALLLFPPIGDFTPPVTSELRLPSYALDPVDSAGSLLFHTAPSAFGSQGAPIACASCHPEGIEDGHTWLIDGQPRRTQSLAGGVSQRAPFHWAGDLPSLGALVGETFTHRMGGGAMPPNFQQSLRDFLDSVPALRARALPPDQLARGQAAFAKAGCGSCHAGEQLAGGVFDVGTGGSFKAPSLIGLHARADLMHSGCAATLLDRFDGTACGGTHHGAPAALSVDEFMALLAYLQTR